MKKLILVLAMLVVASPAMAVNVTITVNNDYGDTTDGIASIEYTVVDANVSGFGLDIEVTGANIVAVDNYFRGECGASDRGYGIFPGSFDRIIDPEDPVYTDPDYTPVADPCDAGAQGGLGGNSITVELGTLYEAGNDPNKSGVLCTIQIDPNDIGTFDVTVTENATRGGIVMQNGSGGTLADGIGTITQGWVYPDCWGYSGTGYLTQCHADSSGDGSVGLLDFYDLRDAWNETYPSVTYIPCIDINRDGLVGLLDFYELRDNWNLSVASDCPSGDINEIYKP